MQLNLAVFEDFGIVVLAVLLTLVAVVTKLPACGLGARSLGQRCGRCSRHRNPDDTIP